jgi:hypothetical protein
MSRTRMSRETDDELQIDRRETLIRGYDDFLKRYDWEWWGSLQLKSGRPTTREAERRFNKWIEKLQAEEGTSKFRWVRIIEPGHLRRNPHLHILVAGLAGLRAKWERRWNELGDGDAQIRVYDRNRKGVLYMLKTMETSGNINVDFKLPKL